MSTFQKKLQQDRSNEKTSNAGLRWDPEDDKFLLESAKSGIEISEIANSLKRTEGSIKTRIIINVLNIVGDDKQKLPDVCKNYNITEEDVRTYISKKEQRETRKQAKNTYEKKSNFPSNNDFVEILEGLSLINKKLDTLTDKNNDILKKLNK